MVTMDGLVEEFSVLFSNEVALRLLASLLVAIITLFVLAIVKKILYKFAEARVRDKRVVENTYKMIELGVVTIMVFIIAYILTRQTIIALFILGAVLVVMGAAWEIIANIVSYYAILMTQAVSRGEYVVVGGYEGRVRDVTPLFTFVENETGVYAIPNRLILSRGSVRVKEPVYAKIKVRVWGFEDPEVAEDIASRLRDRLLDALGGISAIPGEVKIFAEEVTVDGVVFGIIIPLPGPRISHEKLGNILREVGATLKDFGYSFSVTAEKYNGSERCRCVA